MGVPSLNDLAVYRTKTQQTKPNQTKPNIPFALAARHFDLAHCLCIFILLLRDGDPIFIIALMCLEAGGTGNGKENGKTIMRASIIYALYY